MFKYKFHSCCILCERERKLFHFPNSKFQTLTKQLPNISKSIYHHKSLHVACMFGLNTHHINPGVMSEMFQGPHPSREVRGAKTPALIYNCERQRGGAKLILLLLLLLSELTVPASLSHTYTHKPISSILFLSVRLSALPSSHSPISFFLFRSLSLAYIHYLSFSRTHAHTAWPFNKHILLVLTKAHFSTHLRFRDDRKHVSSRYGTHTHTHT